MEVFYLTLYICVKIIGPDITERSCDWHPWEYYNEADECRDAGNHWLNRKPTDEASVEEAQCKLVIMH